MQARYDQEFQELVFSDILCSPQSTFRIKVFHVDPRIIQDIIRTFNGYAGLEQENRRLGDRIAKLEKESPIELVAFLKDQIGKNVLERGKYEQSIAARSLEIARHDELERFLRNELDAANKHIASLQIEMGGLRSRESSSQMEAETFRTLSKSLTEYGKACEKKIAELEETERILREKLTNSQKEESKLRSWTDKLIDKQNSDASDLLMMKADLAFWHSRYDKAAEEIRELSARVVCP